MAPIPTASFRIATAAKPGALAQLSQSIMHVAPYIATGAVAVLCINIGFSSGPSGLEQAHPVSAQDRCGALRCAENPLSMSFRHRPICRRSRRTDQT